MDNLSIIRQIKNGELTLSRNKQEYDKEVLIASVVYNNDLYALAYLNDKNVLSASEAKYIVKNNYNAFPIISKKLMNDEIFNFILKVRPAYFKNFPERYKKNKEWALKAIERDYNAFNFINENLKYDKDVILKTLDKNFFYMTKFPQDIFEDKEIRDKVLEKIEIKEFKENFPKMYLLFESFNRKTELDEKINNLDINEDRNIFVKNKRKL